MEKSDFINLTYYIAIGVVILTCGFIIQYLNSNSKQCLKNPFIFGASKLKDIECSCIKYTNKKCPARFSFNDTEFLNPITKCQDSPYNKLIETDFNKILNFSNT